MVMAYLHLLQARTLALDCAGSHSLPAQSATSQRCKLVLASLSFKGDVITRGFWLLCRAGQAAPWLLCLDMDGAISQLRCHTVSRPLPTDHLTAHRRSAWHDCMMPN